MCTRPILGSIQPYNINKNNLPLAMVSNFLLKYSLWTLQDYLNVSCFSEQSARSSFGIAFCYDLILFDLIIFQTTIISSFGKSQNLKKWIEVLTDMYDAMFCQTKMWIIDLFGHCEYHGHAVRKLVPSWQTQLILKIFKIVVCILNRLCI